MLFTGNILENKDIRKLNTIYIYIYMYQKNIDYKKQEWLK